MVGYLQSSAGRALVLAAGVLLTGLGLSSLLSPSGASFVIGLLGPAGATAAGLASIGLGVERYPLRSLAVAMLGPVLLWPSFVAASGERALMPALGHVMMALGVVMVAAFVGLCLKAPARRDEAQTSLPRRGHP